MKAFVSRLTLFVSLLASLMFSVPPMRAQSDVAQISGVISDSSGAILAHANVLMVNQDTGISRTTPN